MEIEIGKSGTITGDIAVGATSVSLSSLPAQTSGYLVLAPDVSGAIEEVSFSHSGSNPVTISATTYTHASGTKFLIDNTNGYYQGLAKGYESQVATTGWVSFNATATYASASSFTLVGDWTDRLAVGDKIKLTNGSVKYFYLTAVAYSSPNTTVTVTGGTDYTVASAAITANYYSKGNAVGFPTAFTIGTNQKLYYVGGRAIVTGWEGKQGSVADNISTSVTFGSSFAFTNKPNVQISGIGVKSSAFTDIGSGGDTGGSGKMITEARAIATTGFTASLTLRDGGNFSTSNYYGYCWVAQEI